MTDRADGGGAVALDAVLCDLDDALDRLSDLALWQLPDAALKTLAAALDRARRRSEGQTVRLLGEVDGRGIPGQDGTRTSGAWLRSVAPDLHPREAALLGQRAEKLYRSTLSRDLAPTRRAVEAGELRAGQEKAIVATVEQVSPPNLPADHPDAVPAEVVQQAQALLIEYAPALCVRDFARLVTELRHTIDPNADDRLAKDEKAQERRRNLVMATDASGMTFVEGLLTKECGAALRAALDAWSAPVPADDGTLDPRSPGQRRHDALQHLAETTLARGDVPTSHGSPVRVIVRVGVETLETTAAQMLPAGRGVPGSRRGASPGEQSAKGTPRPATQADQGRGRPHHPAPPELDDGTPISRELLARMLCGAEIVPVLVDLVDPTGHPLDVGRTLRDFTPRQRIALAERDRGCTWPGCTAPVSWTKAHHLTYWKHGGPTDLTNAALLCGYHHRYVHTTGATGQVINGRVVWHTGRPPASDPPGTDPPDSPAQPLPPHRANHLIHRLVRQWTTPRRQ